MIALALVWQVWGILAAAAITGIVVWAFATAQEVPPDDDTDLGGN